MMHTCLASLLYDRITTKINHDFLLQLLSPPPFLLSLIKKASKIAHLHGPRTSIGHFEFKLHAGVYLHKLGNFWRFRGQNFAFTNYVSEKTFIFRSFPSIKSQGSYIILHTAKWHGCPVVFPQMYVWYKRDQVFVTSKETLALSQTSFLSRKQQVFQGPVWAS